MIWCRTWATVRFVKLALKMINSILTSTPILSRGKVSYGVIFGTTEPISKILYLLVESYINGCLRLIKNILVCIIPRVKPEIKASTVGSTSTYPNMSKFHNEI